VRCDSPFFAKRDGKKKKIRVEKREIPASEKGKRKDLVLKACNSRQREKVQKKKEDLSLFSYIKGEKTDKMYR